MKDFFIIIYLSDVDECAGSHGCAQKCKNTPGGFECECQAGYKLAPDQKNCVGKETIFSSMHMHCSTNFPYQ